MSFTRLAINKNRVTLVALLVIFIAGINAYTKMPQNEDPGFIIRTALVMTFFPGASPDRVERLVTDKLEKVVQEIPQLDFVTSTSKTGVSQVFVNIVESEKNMRPIWDDLRRKMDAAATELPDAAIGPIVNDEFGDVFGIMVSLVGEGYSYVELKDVADLARNELLKIRDAAKVEIHGDQEERVFIEYDNARLAEFGLSAIQLSQLLESSNVVLPGGNINTGSERIALEPSGNFESVEDLGRTIIQVPGSDRLVYLRDLARIRRGYADPPGLKVRSSGEPALVLAVSLRQGGNLLTLGQQVKDSISRLQGQVPIGLEFDYIAFQPQVVQKKVDDFVSNLLQAIAIVLAVMLISLGLRTGLVVSTLIPMTMVMAILVMSFLDIGIDQMSLAALIISLGLLVDNAIVMSESIMVQMAAGRNAVEAAVDSADELKVPLLTSSLTTAAAFLPIYLAESTTGEYTAPIFEVVAIALLCSWLLSLTMIPMLCAYFIRVKPSQGDGYNGRFYRLYRQILLTLVRRPLLSLATTIAIFFIVLQGMALIPNIFFPAKDDPVLTAEFEWPVGTPIERTEEHMRRIESYIRSDLQATEERPEGISNWATFIGQGPPRFMLSFNPKQATPEYGMILVNTTSYPAALELIDKLESFTVDNFPDVKPKISSLVNGPPAEDPVQIRVSGDDADQVFALVDRIKQRLTQISGTKNISDDWGPRTKKLAVRIDQARARRAGLSSQDVALSLQTGLSGFETTQYREGDQVIPVILRTVEADRRDLGRIESLNIFSQATGTSVPLKQVADIQVEWQPSKVLRRDRLKTVTVKAGIAEGITAVEVVNKLETWLKPDSQSWPLGYGYQYGGEIESSVKANQSIGAKLPVAMLIIVLLLVGQFNSVRRPLIILLTIPLGMIGVVIGLIVADSYFGFMTLLGIVSLSGIVINNAIVLLDRVNIEIETNGLEPARALIEAGQRRLRPILLTTCTTIGGMLPLWLGGGAMWESMAIAIIFGLLFATLLTLGVVPVLYTLFFRVKFKDFVY
jgi:multidrug efflux pump